MNAQNKMFTKKWRVVRGNGVWIVDNYWGPKERYGFATEDWAVFCAQHFNDLELAVGNTTTSYLGDCVGTGAYLTTSNSYKLNLHSNDSAEWVCHLFGSNGKDGGITYHPNKNSVPNVFVRWMMRVCFACRWERVVEKQQNDPTP